MICHGLGRGFAWGAYCDPAWGLIVGAILTRALELCESRNFISCKKNLQMDWRALPSLNALRAFCVVADCGSYTRAGSVLNVTHAAVKQQVKALESHLGLPLVVRSGRKLALTAEGKRLASELEPAFHQIGRGLEAMMQASRRQPLRVTMSPVFAVKWLMPRLSDFQTRHPDVTLLLNPSGRMLDLEKDDMDIALRYARRETLPSAAQFLVSLDLAVVGTPELLAAQPVGHPADLQALPWLEELGTSEVDTWFEQQGVNPDRPLAITQMPGNLIMEAVKRSDGVTYTACQWVEEDLREKRLRALFVEPQVGGFYIHCRAGEPRPAARRFIAWLEEQAGRSHHT